jgi:MFS family permease
MQSDPSAAPAAGTSGKFLSSPRLAALGTLRLPSYRYLLLNNLFGQVAQQARLMAQAWLILSLTNSDAWVGIVAGLPALLAAATALLGGVLADRLNRRSLLTGIRLSLAGIALLTALLVVMDLVQIWHLLVLALAVALLDVSSTTTSQTLIVDLVPKEELFGANAVYSAAANLAMMIGPALAGILIAQVGVELAFAFSAAMFVVAAAAAHKIQVPGMRARRSATSTVWEDLKGGLRYVAETPLLQWLLLLGISAIAVGVWSALVPRFARDVLESGAIGYGAILSARGVGGMVGMLTLIAVGNVRRLGIVLLMCALAFAVLVMTFAFSTSLVMAAAIALGLGIVFIWWPASLRTAFQHAGTEEMRGRVMSLFSLVGQLLTFGWLVGGLLSDSVGPQAAMLLVAGLCALLNIVAYWRSADLRSIGREAA